MSRWRLDVKFVADVKLGWRIATNPVKVKLPLITRTVNRLEHIFLGCVYFTATSTFGLVFWIRSKADPERQLRQRRRVWRLPWSGRR